MNGISKIRFVFLLLLMLFVATPAIAAQISLDSQGRIFAPEEEFLIRVSLNVQKESLNAVEGQILFPTDLLEAKDIRNGNSSVNFWIEEPHVSQQGVISFSGITPGGFSRQKEAMFSIVFRAKGEGEGLILAESIRVLRNDGEGTEARVTTPPFSFSISTESKPSIPNAVLIQDNDPPEDFMPMITNAPSVFEGENFLVFATQDKGTGIDHYEVREGRWGWFTIAESPYLLKHQSLDRSIFVKAVDKADNERVAVLAPQLQAPWNQPYILFSILIAIVFVAFLCKKLWPRFTQ